MSESIRCPRCGVLLQAEPLRRRLEGICPRCLAAELLETEPVPPPRRRTWILILASSIVVLGIVAVAVWPRRPPPPPVAAELPFREWRERLIASKTVIIGFKATRGERSFAGKFILQRPNLLCLRMTAHPEKEDWRFVSDGATLSISRGDSTRRVAAPADLYPRVANAIAYLGIAGAFVEMGDEWLAGPTPEYVPVGPGAFRVRRAGSERAWTVGGTPDERTLAGAGTAIREVLESVRFDEPVDLEMFTVKD